MNRWFPLFWYAMGMFNLAIAVGRAVDGSFDFRFWFNLAAAVLMVSTAVMTEVARRRTAAVNSDVKHVLRRTDAVLRENAVLASWDEQLASTSHRAVLETLPDDVRAALGYPVTKREAGERGYGVTPALRLPYYGIAYDDTRDTVTVTGKLTSNPEVADLLAEMQQAMCAHDGGRIELRTMAGRYAEMCDDCGATITDRRPPASEALVPPGTPIPGWARDYFQPQPPTRPSPTRGERR